MFDQCWPNMPQRCGTIAPGAEISQFVFRIWFTKTNFGTNSGPNVADVGQMLADFGQHRPSYGQSWRSLVGMGQILRIRGVLFGRCWPNLADFGRCSADAGRFFSRIWHPSGQSGRVVFPPESGPISADFGHILVKFGQHRPNDGQRSVAEIGRNGPILADLGRYFCRCWPSLADFGRCSADVGRFFSSRIWRQSGRIRPRFTKGGQSWPILANIDH